jgi:hypothetical protein
VINNNPCGKPIVLSLGGVDVSAQNLCLPHLGFAFGTNRVPLPIVMEGDVAYDWGTPEASGTATWTDPTMKVVSAGAYPGATPPNGSGVILRINAIVIGQYRVGGGLVEPGEAIFAFTEVSFHSVNFNGDSFAAQLAPLNGAAVTLDWFIVPPG